MSTPSRPLFDQLTRFPRGGSVGDNVPVVRGLELQTSALALDHHRQGYALYPPRAQSRRDEVPNHWGEGKSARVRERETKESEGERDRERYDDASGGGDYNERDREIKGNHGGIDVVRMSEPCSGRRSRGAGGPITFRLLHRYAPVVLQ